MAVFRSTNESGTIFITDLYCPHLGASLGSGGTVSGDCVTCPFHNWSFDGKTGECVDIPYAKKVLNISTPEFELIKVLIYYNQCLQFCIIIITY